MLSRRFGRLRKLVVLLIAPASLPVVAWAASLDSNIQQRWDSTPAKTGVLLMAHGGGPEWNAEVNKLALAIDGTTPVEVAFGMASRRTIQHAVDLLVERGVTEIVAIPLFVSSHSSVITSTQYLLGQRPDAPSDLAVFAGMDHGTKGGEPSAPEIRLDGTTPVESPVPIRMTGALDRHPLVGSILLSRALSISQEPASEVVVLVAHGPSSDDDNARWLADMAALAAQVRDSGGFARVEYLTVRDDADEAVRSKATAHLRQVVERGTAEDRRVLVVPLLLSFGSIEAGIRKRLEGLNYVMSLQGLLPDGRLGSWVLLNLEETSGE